MNEETYTLTEKGIMETLSKKEIVEITREELDRVKDSHKEQVSIMQKNLDTKMLEIDQWKTKYDGMFGRQIILDKIEKYKHELSVLQLIKTKYLSEKKKYEIEYQKAFYKGAIQAFILVLSHIEDKEVLLQKR